MAKAIQTGNPLGILSNLDPRMKKVFDFINANGGDPETACYALAKQNGLDPQAYIKQAQDVVNANR